MWWCCGGWGDLRDAKLFIKLLAYVLQGLGLYTVYIKRGQYAARGPHPARQGHFFSLKVAYLTEMWPANKNSCPPLVYTYKDLTFNVSEEENTNRLLRYFQQRKTCYFFIKKVQ
jgi:hypothetical protein